MCRRLLLLLSLILSFASVGAQTQTVTLSGQLRSGTEPVAGAVLALLQPSDSSLLTYTISDSEGRYRLQLETSLPALVLRVRSLGFKRRLLLLKAQSQTLDLNLEHEERLLREVIVKAQKLWAQRDTLNYLVSAYTLQQDRTIGDVLQRLPGITIEDNKVIKYQGLPINRFYIEGLDLLRGRYGLATQGIRAQDIATVQVLEHHQRGLLRLLPRRLDDRYHRADPRVRPHLVSQAATTSQPPRERYLFVARTGPGPLRADTTHTVGTRPLITQAALV